VLGIITNAARHEPEAVAALRAGREDTVNRLLRLPLPEPYVPTRLESARDRLRTRPGKQAKAAAKAQAKAAAKAKPKAKPKAAAKAPAKGKGRTSTSAKAKAKAGAKPEPARTAARERRATAQAADRSERRSGHHGGRQRQPSRRARPLEGQRHG
jgi:cell division protein FtsW